MWGPQVLYTLNPYQSTPHAFISMGRCGAYATPSATTLVVPPTPQLGFSSNYLVGQHSKPPGAMSCSHTNKIAIEHSAFDAMFAGKRLAIEHTARKRHLMGETMHALLHVFAIMSNPFAW